MNLTAKSRYALKIMMDLADCDQDGKQQRHKIALRQGLSVDFMDHIMARLRAAQLIESTRGRSGGFQLKRPASSISLWDIFSAVEESIYPVKCMEDDGCDFESSCISHGAWIDVFELIRSELSKSSLAALVAKWQLRKQSFSGLLPLPSLQECRGPSKQPGLSGKATAALLAPEDRPLQ